jgi:hypothetical protein
VSYSDSPRNPDSGDLRRRASLLYRVELALGISGLLAVSAIVGFGLSSLNAGPSTAHRHLIVLADQRLSYPDLNVAGVLLAVMAAIGVVVLVRALGGVLWHWRSQRKLLAGLTRTFEPEIAEDVFVVRDERVRAFCVGLMHPQVWISTEALRTLGANELRAVLAHERHHRARRDPLRLALARVLGDALFFLPVLRVLTKRYGALLELSADEVAARSAGQAALASAMLLFAEERPSSPAGAVGIAADRIDHLLGRPVDVRLPWARAIGSVLGVGLLLLLVQVIQARAVLHATLGLPFLTATPCVTVLALLPGLLGVSALVGYRRVLHRR